VSTPLLRRLLTPVGGGFSRAELILEWGLAKRLTSARPRDLESAWWATRFALTVRRRVPARCFSPAPRVDAAHLAVRRRSAVDTRVAAVLWVLLDAAYARPRDPARAALRGVAPKKVTHRLLGSRPAVEVRVDEWVELARLLVEDRGVAPSRLPRSLRA
jgi:23S rRNA (adenine-N6)-dimethyltransferase